MFYGENTELVKEGADHFPVVLLTKESMDAHKNVIVVNLPHVRFIGGLTK